MANFNPAVINYTWINNFYTAELSSSLSKMAAMFTLLGEGGGGRGCARENGLRATAQVFVRGTNVYKTKDHYHLNPNHEQKFTTWCPASPEKEDPSATAATSALYSAGPVVSDLHLF